MASMAMLNNQRVYGCYMVYGGVNNDYGVTVYGLILMVMVSYGYINRH